MESIELFEVRISEDGLARRYFHSQQLGAGILAEVSKKPIEGKITLTFLEIDDPLSNFRAQSYMEGYVQDPEKATGLIRFYGDLIIHRTRKPS